MDRWTGTEPDGAESGQRSSAEGKQFCPECLADSLVTDAGGREQSCGRCGLVLSEDNIDRGPEWRRLDHGERATRSRTGAPTTQIRHDRGLTTDIGWENRDARGNQISPEKREQIDRLRTWHERTRTNGPGEQNLQWALSETDRMASALGIPRSVREIAAVLYRRALEEDLVQGRSIEGVATSALYIACRQQCIPRSLSEVAAVARVDRKEIARTYRFVARELGLELEPIDPKMYVPRFTSALELSEAVVRKANEIIETTVEMGLLSGKSPTGYAGAAIYGAALLCNEKVTQRAVSEVAEVTEVTISHRHSEQMEAMGVQLVHSAD